MSDKTILATMTGEHYQPVRLHYQVFDRKALLRRFTILRCVEHDPPRSRWVWLYDSEAKNLPFQQSYAQIPRQHHPIVIGSFIPKSEDLIVLDLRSFDRAKLAIPFFDKHIARSVAKVTEAEVVNRLFSVDEAHLTPDQLFDNLQAVAPNTEAVLRELKERIASVYNPLKKLRIASEFVASLSRQSLPEIERLPLHYYEDGIGTFTTALSMRQLIAWQHWIGNTQYSMHDVIEEIAKRVK